MNWFRPAKKRIKPTFAQPQTFILEPLITPSGLVEELPDPALLQVHSVSIDQISLPDSTLAHGMGVVHTDVQPLSGEPLELMEFRVWEEPIGSIDPSFNAGVFTVGASGQVSIDFLFDGGGYQGEVAIFSLDGMNLCDLDTPEGMEQFIHTAAERAHSDSALGHVVISDATEGAKFSPMMGEDNQNSGVWKQVKTFEMEAGGRFAVMLVPNGTVEAVLNGSTDRDLRPLFSLATANPNDQFHLGQIADVTGDGNTFVFEDLRVDGETDKDYNDVVFQIRGATGEAQHLDEVINPNHDWRTTEMGQALIAYTQPYLNPTEVIDTHDPSNPSLPTGPVPISAPLVITEPDGYDFPIADQPLIGVIDTGINPNNPYLNYSQIQAGLDRVGGDADPFLQPFEGVEHGTHVVGTIANVNDDATIWVGRAVGSQEWSNSLIEFVDAAKASHQPNAVVNLSFDLAQVNPDDSITPRYEFTSAEWAALEYAHQNNVIVVAAAGNDNGGISALGQASQKFDNIITVGSAEQTNSAMSIAQGFDRADYSRYGDSLTLMAEGGTEANPVLAPSGDSIGEMHGTSVAAAKVTGAVSQVWAANPLLSFQQVIDILKSTSVDLTTPNWDMQTGAGLLNIAAAVHLAKATAPKPFQPKVITPPTTWSSGVMPIELAASYPITSLNFIGVVGRGGVYRRNSPRFADRTSIVEPEGKTMEFDAWTWGEVGTDIWNGGQDALWFRVKGTSHWMPSAFVEGYPSPRPSLLPPNDPPPPPSSETINGFTVGGVFYPVWRQYRSMLNDPISNVINHSSGAKYQLFQGGSIVNSQFGTFPLYGGIRKTYLNNRGLDGFLGVPKSAEYNWQGKVRQDFAGGYIVWNGSSATAYRNGSAPPSQPTPGQPTPIDSNKFYKPLSSYTVTSGFGSRSYWSQGRWVTDVHTGIDLAAPSGTPVMVAKGGTVVFAGWNTQGYGNLIIVDHGNGQRTYYAHLSQISINNGATVSAGQAIGKVGSTGNSTGPHLHFEVRMNGVAQNPQSYLQF